MKDGKWFIASVSFGRDSLAMLLYILELGLPLDEVLFYDTGMEFQAIYANRDKILPILKKRGIQYTELHPKNDFYYGMFKEPHTSRTDGVTRYGYGWCGGPCRWGTHEKLSALDIYAKGKNAEVYVGIALNEKWRTEGKEPYKKYPLVEADYLEFTEDNCLKYCREHGWNWYEETPATESGFIDLYDILDRVSCWCCANKNLKELKNIYRYLPQYWARLLELQSKLDRPMKNYHNKKHGDYGNLFALEKVFRAEIEQEDAR